MKPFYSDGTVARFALTNISACGETLSFDLVNLGHQIVLSEESVTLSGAAGEKLELTLEADVDWTVTGLPEWLKLTPASGEAGQTTLTLETLSENGSAQEREAALAFTSPSDATVKTVLAVRQQSYLILPPSGLSARVAEEGTVVLRWTAPQEGVPLLSDGFEDTANPNGWTIQNAPGGRGWTWQEDARNYEAYEGNYSMYMKSAWEDLHQDEWLVSPVFAYGSTLTFHSRSIAPQKTVKDQYYYVEVSRDGGQTWEVAYDLMKDCEAVNQWTEITVDLSAWQSDRMQVAFHAYDETEVGLSYWWQVDNVTVRGASEGSSVEGYAVYRNGVRIGTATDCTFTDNAPLAGENIYTVRATGDFGETSDSEAATLLYDPSGVEAVEAGAEVTVSVSAGRLEVRSAAPLRRVRLVSAGGATVVRACPSANAFACDVSMLSRGVYVVVCETEGSSAPVVRKVVVR